MTVIAFEVSDTARRLEGVEGGVGPASTGPAYAHGPSLVLVARTRTQYQDVLSRSVRAADEPVPVHE